MPEMHAHVTDFFVYLGVLMKKIGLLFAILNASLAFASPCPNYDERRFDIIITNHTGEVCSLTHQVLYSGKFLNSEKKTPNSILINEESWPIQLYIPSHKFITERGTYLELSYQCGARKFVTFESQKMRFLGEPLWINPLITITGSASSLSNMDAKYSYTLGSCEKNQSSTMYWTLY